jgi:hypothetical protein
LIILAEGVVGIVLGFNFCRAVHPTQNRLRLVSITLRRRVLRSLSTCYNSHFAHSKTGAHPSYILSKTEVTPDKPGVWRKLSTPLPNFFLCRRNSIFWTASVYRWSFYDSF